MADSSDQFGRSRGKPDADAGMIASAYRAHAAALYRYAVILTADAAAAEDAVQQVFAKLAGRRRFPWPVDSDGLYLRRAVRNECYRILNRRRRAPVGLDGSPILAAASNGPADREKQAMIERALRRLPPEQREVIHMKIYEQLTFRQIAGQIGVSINTVAGRYRYGLEKLRRLLTRCQEDAL